MPAAGFWSRDNCAASGDRWAKPISHTAHNPMLRTKFGMCNPRVAPHYLQNWANLGEARRCRLRSPTCFRHRSLAAGVWVQPGITAASLKQLNFSETMIGATQRLGPTLDV